MDTGNHQRSLREISRLPLTDMWMVYILVKAPNGLEAWPLSLQVSIVIILAIRVIGPILISLAKTRKS